MEWTFIDAIYFAMTTISTVGYGDLSVALDSAWMVTFTVLYIMGGFVIAFPRLTAAVTFVIQPFFDVMAEAIERTFPQRAIDIDGNGDYDYKIPRHPLIYYSKGLLGPLITFVLVQCLFSALFIWIEPDWDHYGIAYYHCMVTASTVGYGDLTIVTQRGKLLAFFHIFVSVSLLAAMLSDKTTTTFSITAPLHRSLSTYYRGYRIDLDCTRSLSWSLKQALRNVFKK